CSPHHGARDGLSQADPSCWAPIVTESEGGRSGDFPGRNCPMTRYGAQFGPDITFAGVPAVDVDDAAALAAADVVVVGAPFDGGTSHRPGTRFGPTAIRQTDYLPQDGSRPHLALRVDALQDLAVVDMGDVEMPPGEIERALHALEGAVYAVASAGSLPLVLGGDHSIALPDATG